MSDLELVPADSEPVDGVNEWAFPDGDEITTWVYRLDESDGDRSRRDVLEVVLIERRRI